MQALDTTKNLDKMKALDTTMNTTKAALG